MMLSGSSTSSPAFCATKLQFSAEQYRNFLFSLEDVEPAASGNPVGIMFVVINRKSL